jgi:hypothetical protein
MNLLTIGNTVINVERINGIQDQQTPSEPGATAGERVLRVLFDEGMIELAGVDARIMRKWLRHNARNLAPRVDEDGAEFVSPEDQLLAVCDHLLALIQRAPPADSAIRKTARRLSDMIENYITGELRHVRAEDFKRRLDRSDLSAPLLLEEF